MDNRNLVRDSIKYALPSLPLMYLNFFIDAGARSYSADLTGRFFNAILENQYAAARGLLGGMIAMVLVCTVFLPLWAMLTNALYFSLSLKYDLRVTSAFYSKRYERMRAFETGEVAERIFRDPDDLLTLIAVTPTHLLAQASAYMLMIVFMARLSPLLCAACVFFGLTGAACPLALRKKLAEMDAAKKNLANQTAAKELEMIRHGAFFRCYDVEKMLPQEQQTAYDAFRAGKLSRGLKWDALAGFIPQMCLLLGNVFFLTAGFKQVAADTMGAGNLVAFFTYLGMSASLVTRAYDLSREMFQLPDCVKRVESLVDGAEDGGAPVERAWKRLDVRGAAYRYQPDAALLQYDDIRIDRGDCVEVRGGNGSGKTTLVRLLCGLLTPEKGAVSVDGRSIAALDPAQWRRNIDYVEQQPTVFPGTIRENVRIGDLEADDARVDEALRRLNLTSEADRTIQGAGELSGGELKRVALARAVLKNADTIILDEPFEHLDAQGRAVVQALLNDESKTRLCIVHGEDSVPRANRQIVV